MLTQDVNDKYVDYLEGSIVPAISPIDLEDEDFIDLPDLITRDNSDSDTDDDDYNEDTGSDDDSDEENGDTFYITTLPPPPPFYYVILQLPLLEELVLEGLRLIDYVILKK